MADPEAAVLRVGVLASGRGSNFAAIAEAAASGRLAAHPVVLVADRASAAALDRVRASGHESWVVGEVVAGRGHVHLERVR